MARKKRVMRHLHQMVANVHAHILQLVSAPLEPSPFVGYFRWTHLPCEHSRELKKLRQLLQRKCHFKIELCGRLIVLRLFHVG